MLNTTTPKITVYEYLLDRSRQYSGRTALSFYGKTFSYETLFEKIDEAERALRACGVTAGDTVAVSLPGIPEAVFLLCAINKIGAIYCAFDCRSKETEVLEMLKAFTPKLCFVSDFHLKDFCNVHFTPVIYIAPTNCLEHIHTMYAYPADLFTGRLYLTKKHKNFFTYKEFSAHRQYGKSIAPQRNDENIFGYFYTSGTTYGRKSIILSNANVIAALQQLPTALSLCENTESFLNFMPMFACYGVTVGTLLPLILGITVKLHPLLKPRKLKKLLLKEKPSLVMSVPAHWEHFVNSSFKKCDLSFLQRIIVGGDRMDAQVIAQLHRIFRDCSSNAWVCKGYALSESTACGVISTKQTPVESVGKPLEQTEVQIFDPAVNTPVPAGTVGEICICGPTVCCGYYKDEAMTKALLRQHADGKTWLHTGDLGYMDTDGNLYFRERLKRMYVRFDGTKVSPFGIEQALMKCPAVSRCMVTAIKDSRHAHGMCAQAMIVPAKGMSRQRAMHEIKHYIHGKMAAYMWPQKVLLVQKLQYTKMGKLDYFGAPSKP